MESNPLVQPLSTRWALAFILVFIGLLAILQTDDAAGVLLLGLLSLAASFPIYKWIKKAFFRPIVVWDIHGVFVTGDLELENLYEIQGTKDLIQRVRKNHYVIAFTNFNPELFAFYAKKWGWYEIYDELHNSGALKARKPTPEAFGRFLKKSGVSKSDIVFIDDRAENVDAAKKQGIRSIQFQNPQQTETALKELGVKT